MAEGKVNCDACFLFRGDVRYDSRLRNVLHTLRKVGQSCHVIQGALDDSAFECEGASVGSFQNRRRGPLGFFDYWRKSSRHTGAVNARIWWAAELYSLPLAVREARKRNSKVVYDAREIFAHLAALRNRPLSQGFWRYLERRYIAHADAVITSGDMDAEFLAARFGIDPPHVALNVPRFREVARTHRLHELLGLKPDIPICLYIGGLQEGRGIGFTIKLAAELPEAAFVFVGDGPLAADLRKAQKQTSNVYHLPAVPNDQVIDLAASATVGLALIEPISFSYQLALPNKLFEYITAGTPVVVTNLPQMHKIVEEHHVGIAVSPDDFAGALSAIRRLLSDSALHAECAASCCKAARTLSWEAQEQGLLGYLRAREII